MTHDQASFDVSGMQPEAQEILLQVARAHRLHLGSDLISLVAHGSAVKGGIILGSSDVDYMTFVSPVILTPGGQLPFGRAVDLHRDLAAIDHRPFRYLQGRVYPVGDGPPTGFIPGTYQIVTGSPDVPLARSESLLADAANALDQLDAEAIRDRIAKALLDNGEGRLERQVRLLCTEIWPTMYQVASLHEGDGLRAWQRTKPQSVDFLRKVPTVGAPLQSWMTAIIHHQAVGETVESGLCALEAGTIFLDAVSAWYAARETMR